MSAALDFDMAEYVQSMLVGSPEQQQRHQQQRAFEAGAHWDLGTPPDSPPGSSAPSAQHSDDDDEEDEDGNSEYEEEGDEEEEEDAADGVGAEAHRYKGKIVPMVGYHVRRVKVPKRTFVKEKQQPRSKRRGGGNSKQKGSMRRGGRCLRLEN
jgi:hypothetical protein